MAGSLGGGRRGGGFTDINVTPLVDVMLVLLVVFMVTAPLLATGLRVELPDVQAAETPVKDTKLVVTVTKEEKVMLGERDITAGILEEFQLNPRIQSEKELYIRADKDARYEAVAKVVAAARRAGVEGLNLLVQPEFEDDQKTNEAVPVKPAGDKTK
jgi:biopolymer transport protein TolR